METLNVRPSLDTLKADWKLQALGFVRSAQGDLEGAMGLIAVRSAWIPTPGA